MDLPDEEIIQLGIMLLNYYAELKKFGVDDINVLKNGNYLDKQIWTEKFLYVK